MSRSTDSSSSEAARDGGFTVIELMGVLLVSLTVLALGIGGFRTALDTLRGDASMNIVHWQLKMARETAINQRRSVELRFTPPNFMSIVRLNIPAGTTEISTAVLEHQTQFYVFPSIADTPDAFGNASAVDFGAATAIRFNSEGRLVDETGTVLNGTVFVGKPNAPMTARALTIFGPTSAIRTYRWNGAGWRH